MTRPLAAATAIVLATALSVSPAAQGPERFSGPSSQALHQLFNDYWEWRLANEPELATQVGRAEHNARWSDLSGAARDRARGARQEYLERAMFLSPGTLSPSDRLSALLLEYELRTQLEVEPMLRASQTVSQLDGVHNAVFRAVDAMPSARVADYDNILARLRGLPAYVDQAIALMDEQLAAGLAQPAVVVDLMLDQVSSQAILRRSAHRC